MNPVLARPGWRLPKGIRLLWVGGTIALGLGALWLARSSGAMVSRNAQQPTARAEELSGRIVDLFQCTKARIIVFIFVSVECPISNSYAPELRRLVAEFAPRGVTFRLIYPNPDESADAIRAHLGDYGYQIEAFRDPQHDFTRVTGARVTPEAVVFVPGQGLVYRGRIDDRFVDFGQARSAAMHHDLKDAITSILSGKPVAQPTSRAVGCYIANAP